MVPAIQILRRGVSEVRRSSTWKPSVVSSSRVRIDGGHDQAGGWALRVLRQQLGEGLGVELAGSGGLEGHQFRGKRSEYSPSRICLAGTLKRRISSMGR